MGSVYSLADDENSMKRNNYDGGEVGSCEVGRG